MKLTTITELRNLFANDARCKDAAQALSSPHARVDLVGLLGSGRTLTAHAISELVAGTHVFVLNDKEDAAYFMNDLEALRAPLSTGAVRAESRTGQGVRLLFFPAPSRSPYDPEGHHDGERVSRTEVLEVLMNPTSVSAGSNLLIVTYADAMVPLVVGQESMQKNTLTIQRKEELPIETLEEWLHTTGFVRVDFVYEPGQFSVRGGIVDIFSYGNDNPYRIELFGDTVESIRRFDPQDQLSVERLAQAVIVPDLQDEDAADQQLFFSQLPKDAVIWYNNSKVISDAATHRMKRLEEAY
ncbi:MAG TPA: hypothetical protein PLD17_16395, partial [Flavobacteriales bacterium]|nr:hypothetical protein [Flavobacteriales bacterium]